MTVAGMLLSYGAAKDAYFKYVTMLLPGNGTNGAQNNTFLDSSTNALALTRNGNTTQGTFSPYGSNWSVYINGGEANAGSNASFAFGTGAYTVEFWIYQTLAISSYTAGQGPCFVFNDASGGWGIWNANSAGVGIVISARSGSNVLASGTNIPLNQWNHVVAVRSGTGSNQTSIFLNGTRIANGTDATNWTVTGPLKMGGISTGGFYSVGYMSNVRVVKGSAIYDPTQTALAVPTTPLTAVANTSLLTLQSNRFVDNSTTAATITAAGSPTPSIQRFSPFSPSSAYSTTAIGGSGYFDGNGDNVQVTTATSSVVVTGGAFTLEAWVYNTNTGGSFYMIISQDNGSSTGQTFQFRINANKLEFLYFTTSARSSVVTVASTGTINTNAWAHIAVTWGGANTPIRLFINGNLDTTTANVATIYAPASISTAIGSQILASPSAGYFTGYISDARILKGTQLYTATFTPPSSPLTAITNTALLCNFTNAGIIDNAMMNDLETIGNAQISTTQSKFGGSSINFDGVGDCLKSNSTSSDLCTFGTGDFTIEMWLYLTNVSVAQVIFDTRPAATNGVYPDIYFNNSGSTINWYISSVDRITSSAVSINTWYHVAVCRSGSSTKMFINGTQAGSTYTDTNNYLCAAQRPVIGVNATDLSTSPFFGYIDDLRVTKGYARYTANFTVPSSAFPTS